MCNIVVHYYCITSMCYTYTYIVNESSNLQEPIVKGRKIRLKTLVTKTFSHPMALLPLQKTLY